MSLFRGGHRSGRGERGQVLVIFTIAAVAIIAMVGLVIDGGWTFVQRRDEQNVADAAAMAGGYAYINSGYDAASAIAAARDNATANGYAHGVDGATVDVTVNGSNIVVNVTKPHDNFFAGIVGFSRWDVSTTATVEAGIPNAAVGAMPVIFHKSAPDAHGYGSSHEFSFDEPPSGPQSIPLDDHTFNWTVFCTANGNACNANTNQVSNLINGHNSNPQTVDLGMDIDPLNAGSHTALFSDLAAFVGEEFPVAIVNDAGEFQGLALFHLTGSVGGSTKQLSGYFVGPIKGKGFKIVPNAPAGSTEYGSYALDLVN
jgi:Flp pilus assembly protein TadG